MLDHWLEQEIAQGVQHDDTLHHERPLYHGEYPRSKVGDDIPRPRLLYHQSVTVCMKYVLGVLEGRKEMFYLTTHSTHFIYGYMASDIW